MVKRQILKEHGEATRGLHIAVDIIKSNDTNCVLFAYLILKKAEQKLVTIRDEIASQSEFKDLMMCLNSELKEISMEVSKYNLSENLQNWKALVKATGEFHRNYRAFYTMVAFLAGEIPREDLSHVEMQMEVRSKIYWVMMTGYLFIHSQMYHSSVQHFSYNTIHSNIQGDNNVHILGHIGHLFHLFRSNTQHKTWPNLYFVSFLRW